MDLDMPITRVLLNSGPSGAQDAKQAKLTVRPAQIVNKLPIQLDISATKCEDTESSMTVGRMCDSNKYKMSVARRNERERRRVQHVNRTFDTLRQHVQGYRNANKKMSKVETLRCAVEYIRELQTILGLSEEDGVLCTSGDFQDQAMDIGFDGYQMPITPSSPVQPCGAPSFEYPSEEAFCSPESNTSSPLPSSPGTPAGTQAELADHLMMKVNNSLPASPVSPPSTSRGILADRLRMPLLDKTSNTCIDPVSSHEAVIVKRESFDCGSASPDLIANSRLTFDFNANATPSYGTVHEAHLRDLDEQSYNKLAAALQQHSGQQLGQLNFADFSYALS